MDMNKSVDPTARLLEGLLHWGDLPELEACEPPVRRAWRPALVSKPPAVPARAASAALPKTYGIPETI